MLPGSGSEQSVCCWSARGLWLLPTSELIQVLFFVEGDSVFFWAVMLPGLWDLAESCHNSNNWQHFPNTVVVERAVPPSCNLQLPPLLSSLLPCIKWSRNDLVGVTTALSVRWLEISGSKSLAETSSLTEQLCWDVDIACTRNSWRDFLRLRLYWWLLLCLYSSWVSLQGLCLYGMCNKNDPAFSCILYWKLQRTVPASLSLSVLSIICSEVLSCF